MNRLLGELQRLYFPAPWRGRLLAAGTGEQGGEVSLHEPAADELAQALAGEARLQLALAGDGTVVRGMVLCFTRRADWPQVAGLYQSLQAVLDLPAPAIAANGDDGYQLWFSLAEGVPAAVARAFLSGLCARYLADLPPGAVRQLPEATAPDLVDMVPAYCAASGKWSAFIDPGMGSMFVDEPGLDMAPNLERQADMLAGLRSIGPGTLQQALALLGTGPAQAPAASPADPGLAAAGPLAAAFADPQSFLLAVMNDASLSLEQRMAAAIALLPHMPGKPGG